MDEDRSLFAVSDRSLFWQCSGHLGCVQVQTDAYSSKLPHRQYGCELHIQCLEILRLSNSKKKKDWKLSSLGRRTLVTVLDQ